MKPVGILRFLGTNCDFDVMEACNAVNVPFRAVWWADRFDSREYSAFILPGGFSYGDYLRAGAMAARSPAMKDVSEAALRGVPVLGICNGFQILCEAGLLPGVLTRNLSQNFQEQWVELAVESRDSFWGARADHRFRLPIAHAMGRFVANETTLNEMAEHDQVWLTYAANPNGSLRSIAGITNRAKNVAGLMPHPERAMHKWMGSSAGEKIFEVLNHVS